MRKPYYLFAIIIVLNACIGTDVIDDFVEAKINIDNPITSLKVGSQYQFKATFFNNVGSPETTSLTWSSSDESVLNINSFGLSTGITEGKATVMVSANGISDVLEVMVSDTTVLMKEERIAELSTVSSYPLSGNAILKKQNGKVVLVFDDSFETTSALPGLYVYLTNNTSTINNALEVAKVKAFSGAQTYEIEGDIELNTYDFVLFFCKPFLVPVGNGELKP